jgi:hypothetical protein
MYYYVTDQGTIVESDHSTDPQAEAQRLANLFRRSVYVIQGQHSGIEATPEIESTCNCGMGEVPPFDHNKQCPHYCPF